MNINKTKIIFWILIYTILLDTLLGYPYSNILIGIIPLNEILLIISIIVIFNEIPKLLSKYQLLIPLVILSIFCIIRAFFDFFEYGLWAFRDVMHFIEIWWMFPTLFLLEKGYLNYFIRKLIKSAIILIPFKLLAILLKPYSETITIHGIQGDIPLLTSIASWGLIVFPVFFYSIFFEKKYIKILVGLYFFLFIAITESRNVYLALIFSFIYFISLKFSFKTLINVFKYLFIGITVLYIISNFTFLNEYTRFGIESIRPDNIVKHLLSSTGKETSEKFSGAAGGVIQRLLWWTNTIKRTTSSTYTTIFGLGFGIPLTDHIVAGGKIVREPHNSFISTFARAGLLGFIIWFIVIFNIIIKNFFIAKKNYKNIRYYPVILPINFLFIYIFFLSLSEPPFELPFEATVIYIFLGVLYFYKKNHKILLKGV